LNLDRQTLAERVCQRLDAEMPSLISQWRDSAPINHFVLLRTDAALRAGVRACSLVE
jgi:hypothetical protein